MRNLLDTPSPLEEDAIVEAADWVELNALFKADGSISREDLARAIVRDSSVGDNAARTFAADVFKELTDRSTACGRASGRGVVNEYPFELNKTETLLSVKKGVRIGENRGSIYAFLLVATRAAMGLKARRLSSTDPTVIFERLCSDVLLEFWGGSSEWSGALVFGTARRKQGQSSAFLANIEHLCKSIGEGSGWRASGRAPGGGDGKLDLVAWRRFHDGRSGGLIGFAQCKTGIHWKEHVTKLRPSTFCADYMKERVIIEPLRIYMVPNCIDRNQWNTTTVQISF